jgi:cysteine desulfurase
MNKIYLDNNATTAIDERVQTELLAQLEKGPLNSSSIHAFGQEAKAELARARRKIASACGAQTSEVLFHSGATEGLNAAIRSAFKPGDRVISTRIEHSAVYETLRSLKGVEVIYLSVGAEGRPSLIDLQAALERGAQGLVISAANSETGALFDIEQAGQLAERYGAVFICDATALMGKAKVAFYPGIDSMHFSAHKFHGPVSIGFSLQRQLSDPRPLMTGGGQEGGWRSGTQSVPLIAALALAVELAQQTEYAAIAALRDRLENALLELPGTALNGTNPRLCNTTNIAFSHIEGDALFMALDLAGVAVSLGSACGSGALEPSRALREMGCEALSSVRFSLSRMTRPEEIEQVIEICRSIYANAI